MCCVFRVGCVLGVVCVFLVPWVCVGVFWACCSGCVWGRCRRGRGAGAGVGGGGWSVWVFNPYLWAGCAGGSRGVVLVAWRVGGDAAAGAAKRGAAAWCSVFCSVCAALCVCFRVLRGAPWGRRGARGCREVLLALERRRRCGCAVCNPYFGVQRGALRPGVRLLGCVCAWAAVRAAVWLCSGVLCSVSPCVLALCMCSVCVPWVWCSGGHARGHKLAPVGFRCGSGYLRRESAPVAEKAVGGMGMGRGGGGGGFGGVQGARVSCSE